MRKIDWTKWSAISEILGAIAIVATLMYLAIQTEQLSEQTRQNTEALQAGARQAALDAELGLLHAMIENPILYGTPDDDFALDGYDDIDGRRAAAWQLAFFRTRENFWIQHQYGVLDARIWESYRSVLVENLQDQEPARQIWQSASDQFDQRFVDEVNSYLDPP